MIIESKFKLGDILQDKISGHKGTVMVVAKYHTGCISYGLLQNKLNADGTIPDWQWIDQGRLKLVEEKDNVIYEKDLADERGGNHPDPPIMG